MAAVGDESVEARVRPPVEARLAAIHAELGRRGRGGAGESLRGPVAAGMTLGFAAAAALLLWPSREPALTFAVGEPTQAGEEGAWLVAPPAQELPVGFSDGSRLRLAGGARARVFDLGAHGARVGIERGSLRAEVVPRAGNAWSVVGGPFEIRVTGTSFDAGWDPEREELRVTMHEGHVVVRAACLDHERALAAGDAVTLACPSARHAASALEPAGAPSPSTLGAPPAAPRPRAEAPALEPPALGSTAPAPASSGAWRDRSRAGDYQGALAAAEGEGWSTLCNTVSAADLLELGTLARLAGARARAVEAYTTLRSRFAGGDAAATAAFHLGQLAFDGAHAYAEAHAWFAAYLAERPSGALAGEALGRSMEAEQRLGDLDAARETARRYLARYPTGAHAGLAGSLVAP
jgi:TolA-binding protein